jgi:hypothetical protein
LSANWKFGSNLLFLGEKDKMGSKSSSAGVTEKYRCEHSFSLEDKKWWSMLGVANWTSGIGVRTAHNIQCISIKKPLKCRFRISVISARQRMKTEIAHFKEQKETISPAMSSADCFLERHFGFVKLI